MTIFDFLTLLGGLALFLFGMQVMGNGLQRVSGSKLEHILERLTSTPIKGVLLGAGVTAVIQSSSATTVMVVGFVNSGIMQLRQVVGIIMGANLGTTITAWILSLTGISGTSLLAQMFKPTSFSPLLAFVGVILLLFAKKDKVKDIGTIFLGFTVLMYGMEFMSSSVAPLAESRAFADLLVKFSNPVLGILAGAIITAILQSSSASVGILQAIAISGILPFASAVPIIMGQNIGTCVTALLSCIGTSGNAKRAAFIHLYFNVFGCVIFLAIFYIVTAIFSFGFLSQNITAAEIAIVHTTFNIIATVCLLPFTKFLERIATATVRDERKKQKADPLQDDSGMMPEELFLASPSFAVEHCRSVLLEMIMAVKANVHSVTAIDIDYDEEEYRRVMKREELVDKYEHRINAYLLKLNQTDLSSKDSASVSTMLNVVSDLERISDHAVNVANVAHESNENGLAFSKWGKEELSVFNRAILENCDRAMTAFVEHDVACAKSVQPLEDVIDSMRDELKHRHIRRLQKGECTVQLGLYFIDIINDLERISDYGANLAGYILHDQNEQFDTHRYWSTISEEDRDLYRKSLEYYNVNYVLPAEDDDAPSENSGSLAEVEV